MYYAVRLARINRSPITPAVTGIAPDARAFLDWIKPLRKIEWVVYAKRPFAGSEAVLAYLSRYTHRVAIANSRLLKFNDQGVTFKWKDYRSKQRLRQIFIPPVSSKSP